MKKLTLLLSFVLLAGLSAFGQTALVMTTLSAAVADSKTTTMVLGSATGVAVGKVLFIEDGTSGGGSYNGGLTSEAAQVTSINSTTVTVQRGAFGTIANPHLANVVVMVGSPDAFVSVDPAGSCTAANTLYTPTINLKNGNQWLCSTITSSWVPGFFNTTVQAGITTAVASVAGATNPSGPYFHVTGTNAITAWGSTTAIGMLGGGGSATNTVGANFCVIPDAIFTWTATNNIALAGTAVVNKLLCFYFDPTNKKYIPGYIA